MRFLGLFLCSAALFAAEDPREIVRRAIDIDHHNTQVARDYTYLERQEQRRVNDDGGIARRQSKTFEITLTAGAPYRRLVERDDKPLPPEEQKLEQRKLEASIHQSPEQRAINLRDFEAKRQKLRAAISEVLDAFEFRLAGMENAGGRELYVIEGKPRPGYQPRTQAAKYYSKLKGRIWIDKQDYYWVKAEAELIDPISYGLVLARVQKGMRFTAEQTRVRDEVWLPKRITAAGTIRIALFKKLGFQWEATYRDYRKFQSDSRVVSAEPVSQ